MGADGYTAPLRGGGFSAIADIYQRYDPLSYALIPPGWGADRLSARRASWGQKTYRWLNSHRTVLPCDQRAPVAPSPNSTYYSASKSSTNGRKSRRIGRDTPDSAARHYEMPSNSARNARQQVQQRGAEQVVALPPPSFFGASSPNARSLSGRNGSSTYDRQPRNCSSRSAATHHGI